MGVGKWGKWEVEVEGGGEISGAPCPLMDGEGPVRRNGAGQGGLGSGRGWAHAHSPQPHHSTSPHFNDNREWRVKASSRGRAYKYLSGGAFRGVLLPCYFCMQKLLLASVEIFASKGNPLGCVRRLGTKKC